MGIVRVIDWLVRVVFPGFSIARFLTCLDYQLMTRLLMDQARPLKLPQHLFNRVDTLAQWGDDPKAPGWMSSLEDRMTIRGSWKALADK